MAYLRGDYYLWADDADRLHVWAFDGADAWADAGWAVGADGRHQAGYEQASGVSIPEEVMDEYVIMRFAELIESGKAAAALNRALRHGNFGGEALAARATVIREKIEELQKRSA